MTNKITDSPKDSSNSDDEGERGYQFHPPLYSQRYRWAIDHLSECDHVEHLVDMGCAEGKFLQRARFGLPHVLKMSGIDIDAECCTSAAGVLEDQRDESFFLERRPNPITVQVMKGTLKHTAYRGFIGSIDEYDARIGDVDAVTLIEVIEHVHLAQLARIVTNVFARIQPAHVLVSTPNKEFNVVFGLDDTQTRHWDHKFEWTRDEFESWCTSVTSAHPDYSVVIGGCGGINAHSLDDDDRPYAKYASLGPASQTAVFTRNMDLPRVVTTNEATPFEMVLSTTYAHDPSNRRRNTLRELVVAHCNELIEAGGPLLEAVPGHPRVFFFDAHIVDAALEHRSDLTVFIPNPSHIMAVLLEDRRFDFASNAHCASFAHAMAGGSQSMDRTSQVVYPTTAYTFMESVDMATSTSMHEDEDDAFEEAVDDISEREWPRVDGAESSERQACVDSWASVGDYYTDYAAVLDANGPFLMKRYMQEEFEHSPRG